MDRIALKNQARQVILDDVKTVMIGSLLFVALAAIFSWISAQLLLPVSEQMDEAYRLALQGKLADTDRLTRALLSHPKELALDQLFDLLLNIVRFGFTLFLFRILRSRPVSYGNLLDGFAIWWKILLLELLQSLLVMLWSLLLVIPGIIAAYRYRLSSFLLLTHPDYGVLDCIRESKRLTEGHKMDFFLLDLSFLGWMLLSAAPVLGWAVMLWVAPYRGCTELLYCMQICGPEDAELWEQEDPRFSH